MPRKTSRPSRAKPPSSFGIHPLKDHPPTLLSAPSKHRQEIQAAWTEFFSRQAFPRNDAEIDDQVKDFERWFNEERTLDSSGLTPAEMDRRNLQESLPPEEERAVAKAATLADEGRIEEAVALLSSVMTRDPFLVRAYDILSGIYEGIDHTLCRRTLALWEAVEPDSPGVAYRRSSLALNEGDFASGFAFALEGLKRAPDDFDLLMMAAQCAQISGAVSPASLLMRARRADRGRFDLFMGDLWVKKRLRDSDPAVVAGRMKAATRLLDEGDPARALELVRLARLGTSGRALDKDLAVLEREIDVGLKSATSGHARIPSSKELRQMAKIAYTLRVSLWRQRRGLFRDIEIRADQTLADLHEAIFQAFDRYDEHLYSFMMDCKPLGRSADEYRALEAIGDNDEPDLTRDAATAHLADLELRKGAVFRYLFDYGDMWDHAVRVLCTSRASNGARYPRVVKRVGPSPPQYPEEE